MMVGARTILNASILIVDDQQSNVSLLEQLLGEAGYTCVTSTTNPQEVCLLHRKNHKLRALSRAEQSRAEQSRGVAPPPLLGVCAADG